MPGIINEKLGNVMHKVLIEGAGTIWRRHVNQLKTRLAAWTIPDSLPVTNSSTNSPPVTNNPSPTSARAEQSENLCHCADLQECRNPEYLSHQVTFN